MTTTGMSHEWHSLTGDEGRGIADCMDPEELREIAGDYLNLEMWLLGQFCPTHGIDTTRFDPQKQALGSFIQELLRRYAEAVGGLRESERELWAEVKEARMGRVDAAPTREVR